MDLIYNLISIVAALCFAFYSLKTLARRWPEKKRYPPIAGTILDLLKHFDSLHDYMTQLSRKHKTYRILDPFQSQIYTVDPANVEYILKTNFPNYGKGLYNYITLKELFGDGIFSVDGDKWRHQRKLSSYEFSTKVSRDFSSGVFRSNAAKLVRKISEAATSEQSMDIQDLFMRSTLDSIFKVGFGVELNSLCEASDEGKQFSKAFDDSSRLILLRYVDVTWKIKRFLNIGSEAEIKKNIKVIDNFVYKLINRKIEQISNQEDNSMKKEDILSRFLALREKDPNKMDNQYLRDIILNFIIAGKDTTAGTLTWFFYMLCKHPLVQEKIAKEVREATGVNKNKAFDEFATEVTDEALDKMQYLHAALTETLRLYPAVPVDAKICFSDDTLPDGFSLRKGDMVNYQAYAMGRMKFIWGEDVEVYRPERWLDDNGMFRPESPFKFTAFQAGPRICLGKDFAYRQMKIFSAVLAYCFTFRLADNNKAVNYRTMITLHVDQGLHLCAAHRKSEI
eukprot:TRINITY_DN23934_c0_g1_i1.p1 TRINITY_DN23934_c0_g1~~TRINITY_DN23934_c0_g1_i1.p1  ORF type:complete len:508 (-),score=69.42 TRINITY_DN23934_c0_g1_i1:305-1828(-)